MSPEWEIFFRKSMELSYGVPEGVNGTRKNLSLVAWTACSYLRRLRSKLHVYGTGKNFTGSTASGRIFLAVSSSKKAR